MGGAVIYVASVFALPNRLKPEDQVSAFPRRPTHLLLGVNAIVAETNAYGAYSTTGCLAVAQIAKHFNASVYVLAESTKIRKDVPETPEERIHYWLPKDHFWLRLRREEVRIYNPLDDKIPSCLIDAFITEDGVFAPEELKPPRGRYLTPQNSSTMS